jgi:RNA polymerase sigma-70 factor (ECF subfamily)
MSNLFALRAPATPGAPWSDEAVAYACGSGDPEAVGELFERFHVPVTRFLSRVVGGAEVEDLVQSIFLQVARGKARYEGRASVKTWLFGIAANVMKQHFRSAARRRRLALLFTYVHREESSDRVCEQVEARRNLRHVSHVFEALPEKARVAFVLCEVEGLSARDAAQILGTTEVAVWKRVSDVRRALLHAVEGVAP